MICVRDLDLYLTENKTNSQITGTKKEAAVKCAKPVLNTGTILKLS